MIGYTRYFVELHVNYTKCAYLENTLSRWCLQHLWLFQVGESTKSFRYQLAVHYGTGYNQWTWAI